MPSMRRRWVASTSVRRYVPAGNVPPLAPQYSKPWPPDILNLPTPVSLIDSWEITIHRIIPSPDKWNWRIPFKRWRSIRHWQNNKMNHMIPYSCLPPKFLSSLLSLSPPPPPPSLSPIPSLVMPVSARGHPHTASSSLLAFLLVLFHSVAHYLFRIFSGQDLVYMHPVINLLLQFAN